MLQESFDGGTLDPSRWVITSEGDFREMIVDVVDVDPGEMADYRLRLRANTIGASDDNVKFLGVRNLQLIDLAKVETISFELDWNNQTNGSYLTAGMFLCPVSIDTNPALHPDWIAFEYIGVPPGQNGRFQIAGMDAGNLKLLYTEGWPERQRIGRRIAKQKLELVIDAARLTVRENGKEVFSGEHRLSFSQAYLYLQMSSHSNYPGREVYFDNVVVK